MRRLRRLRRCMAVALALAIGGSGSFSFANMSEAAEPVEMSETADLTVSAGIEDSEADESSLTAQAEQDSKSEAGETENGQKVSAGTESGDEEQQESQESPEGTEELDSSDISEDGSAAKPDDNTGTDSSRESAEQDSSSETEGEETPDQSSGSGTDVGDVSSGDNVDGSGSVPSSDPDSNAVMGGNAENPEQSGGAVSSEEESGQDSSSVPESSQVLSDAEKNSFLDRTEIAGDAQGADLQIPEKITVVVDPWEIKGEGQIHSEQYIISNKGTTAVKLTLYNLACVPQEAQGGIVKTERDGIHQGGSKAIYMEMIFGNGDSVLFTEDGSSRYEIELAAGEELSFQITGELNENAAEPWRDGDFQVIISYEWDDGVQVPAEMDGGKAVSGEMGDTSLDAGGIISNGTAEKEENSADSDSAIGENQPLDEATVEGESVSLKEGAAEAGSLSPEADSADKENVMPDGGAVKEGDMPLTENKGSEKGDSVASEEASVGDKNLSEGIEEEEGGSHNDDEKESSQESLDTGRS